MLAQFKEYFFNNDRNVFKVMIWFLSKEIFSSRLVTKNKLRMKLLLDNILVFVIIVIGNQLFRLLMIIAIIVDVFFVNNALKVIRKSILNNSGFVSWDKTFFHNLKVSKSFKIFVKKTNR